MSEHWQSDPSEPTGASAGGNSEPTSKSKLKAGCEPTSNEAASQPPLLDNSLHGQLFGHERSKRMFNSTKMAINYWSHKLDPDNREKKLDVSRSRRQEAYEELHISFSGEYDALETGMGLEQDCFSTFLTQSMKTHVLHDLVLKEHRDKKVYRSAHRKVYLNDRGEDSGDYEIVEAGEYCDDNEVVETGEYCDNNEVVEAGEYCDDNEVVETGEYCDSEIAEDGECLSGCEIVVADESSCVQSVCEDTSDFHCYDENSAEYAFDKSEFAGEFVREDYDQVEANYEREQDFVQSTEFEQFELSRYERLMAQGIDEIESGYRSMDWYQEEFEYAPVEQIEEDLQSEHAEEEVLFEYIEEEVQFEYIKEEAQLEQSEEDVQPEQIELNEEAQSEPVASEEDNPASRVTDEHPLFAHTFINGKWVPDQDQWDERETEGAYYVQINEEEQIKTQRLLAAIEARMTYIRSALHELANSMDESVRIVVAQDVNCPDETMQMLAHDLSEEVRLEVAMNPVASLEVLHVLANDIIPAIASTARRARLRHLRKYDTNERRSTGVGAGVSDLTFEAA